MFKKDIVEKEKVKNGITLESKKVNEGKKNPID